MKRTVFILFCLVLCLSLAVTTWADEKDKTVKSTEGDKALELKACGPKEKEVNYDADTDKKNHPTPTPAAGKAMVYVIRPTMMGNKVQTKLAVDGEWKGVNRGNNYFFVELDPGEHHFCSRAENHVMITLTLEPGKTYFLQQHISMGFMKARNNMEVVSEETGREKLAKLNLATWEVKK